MLAVVNCKAQARGKGSAMMCKREVRPALHHANRRSRFAGGRILPYCMLLPAVTLPRAGTVHSGASPLVLEFLVAVRFMADRFWPVVRRHSVHHHHHLLLLLLLTRMRTHLHAPIDTVLGIVGHTRQGKEQPPTRAHLCTREFSSPRPTVPSSSSKHSSGGTSIHSPAVSHPVNKHILVACIMIPATGAQTATVQSYVCVAGSYEPLTSRNSLTHRGTALVDRDGTCKMCLSLVAIVRGAAPLSHSFSALVSAQTSHRVPSLPSKPHLQAPGLLLLCAFMPSSSQELHYYDASRQLSRPKVGKRERTCRCTPP
jgi:hypothetical protein